MPQKNDFGEENPVLEGQMYFQDFELLKAQFTNNIATCYFKMKKFDEAD